MYSFQVVETFTAAPLNMVSGINDMELVEQDGRLMLYTSTRGGGGVLALEVGSTLTLADQEALAPGAALPAPARLELLSIGDETRLVVTGTHAGGLQTYGIEASGTLSAPIALTGGLSGVVAAQAVVQHGGSTYLYLARAGESTIHAFQVGAGGVLSAAGRRVLDDAYPGVDITNLSSVTVGGQTYLVSLSLEADVVRTFALGPDGTIGQPVALGAPQGLGIADPSAVSAVEIGGTSFLVVASAGSSSISIIELSSAGTMRVADHVIDSLDTRFAGVQALTTVADGDRVFVIAAGGDGGVEVMALLPDGRLLSVGRQLDLPGLALDNASAMTARLVDGRIELFVAGEGTGITRLEIDVGPLSPMRRAGPEDTELTGTAGGDLLIGQDGSEAISGGDGADVLSDGAGRDTLRGGAGADIHVLSADGEVDVIADFQLGLDRIDLSAWGRIHALETLTLTATATGVLIVYMGETLEIQAANGQPILPDSLRLTDFIGLWHALPPTSMGGGIVGTNQADLLIGTAGNDIFVASDGADTIDGGAGFDVLDLSAATSAQRVNLASQRGNSGLTADQVLVGIEGITGSRFADQLTGNAVNNWLDGADGNDRLTGAAGDDSLFGSLGIDYLNGGEGADLLDGGAGFDRAGYRDAREGVLVDLADPLTNRGEATGDRYFGIEGLEGSNHADTLRGDAEENNILGANGNDLLEGRDGDDALNGQDGDDTLIGGAGADFLNGDSGFNVASYVSSPVGITLDLADPTRSTGHALGDRLVNIQRIDGSNFADRLSGGTENDIFRGLAGSDRLSGQGGEDWLSGGSGNDSLYGGTEDDTLAGGAGSDRVDGGSGFDVASYADAGLAVVADLATASLNQGDARGDVYVQIEGLEGSGLSDVLFGDGLGNGLWGAGGNDRLDGRAGNDTLFGGEGDDTLTGGTGADVLDGGAGSDWASWSDATAGVLADLADWTRSTGAAALDRVAGIENLTGSAHADSLMGDDGANRLGGGAGGDRLDGRGGSDVLDGGAGNDWLDGGEGSDRLSGRAGNDRAYAGDGNDTLLGGSGNDWLDGGEGEDVLSGGSGHDVVSYAGASAGIVLDLADPASNSGAAAGDRLSGIEEVRATAHADRLTGNASPNILWGEGGEDWLSGGSGNDSLYGGTEDDTLAGGAGSDRVDGGSGFDVASYADAGAAVVADLATASLNQGDARGDVYVRIEGLEGSGLSDVLFGDGLGNGLWGAGGNDRLDGRAGNDTLFGGEGDDTLTGGTGNDWLAGGEGADTLSGGAGRDVFVFSGGSDVILDYTEGQDSIRLDSDLWAGPPPPIADLLAAATVTQSGIVLALADGATLDIRGVFDTNLLADDFLFV